MNANRSGAHWIAVFVAAIVALPNPATAQSAPKVRISGLSDIDFGPIPDLSLDATSSQSVCVYSKDSAYNVTAIGSGLAGAFALNGTSAPLRYEVEWSDRSGAPSGFSLQPNMPLGGQTTAATHQACRNGPAASATLIVRIRSSELGRARMGAYSGSLTLLIGPE